MKTIEFIFCSACIGLVPLTDDSIKTSKKELKHFGKNLSEMKQALIKLKSKRQEDKKKLQEETDKAVKEVEDFRKLIDWVLDRMERKGKDYIQKRFKELNRVITDDISQCEEMLTFLEKAKSQWKCRKDENLVEQYVNMRQGKQAMKTAQGLCDRLKCRTSRDIVKFTVDPKVERFARNLSWFGKDKTYLSFEQPLSFPHLYEIKQDNQFDIRVRGDKHVCSVTDMCQLEDGTILTVDVANRRVKQLDVLYQIVDVRDLPGDPIAVSCLNDEKAIVAVDLETDTRIQYIQVTNGLPLGDSFTIPGQCTALTSSTDAIYVSAGNKISKYNTDGVLVHEHDTGIAVERITLTRDYEKLIYLDNTNRLSVLDKHFEILNEVQIENVKRGSNIAIDSNGQLFISMFDLHSIAQCNHDLRKLGVVVGQSNGVKNPQAIVFDRINNRLVVSMKFKNIIKAFELK